MLSRQISSKFSSTPVLSALPEVNHVFCLLVSCPLGQLSPELLSFPDSDALAVFVGERAPGVPTKVFGVDAGNGPHRARDVSSLWTPQEPPAQPICWQGQDRSIPWSAAPHPKDTSSDGETRTL